MRLVAAMDPANPYGAALPSPIEGFARLPGAYLVLEGGKPVLKVESGGRRIVPVNGIAGGRLVQAVSTLQSLLRVPAPYRGKRLEVQLYGEDPATRSDARLALGEAGFEESGDAMILWPSRSRPDTHQPLDPRRS
jgi:ATP-dependent Lhr-like helicase